MPKATRTCRGSARTSWTPAALSTSRRRRRRWSSAVPSKPRAWRWRTPVGRFASCSPARCRRSCARFATSPSAESAHARMGKLCCMSPSARCSSSRPRACACARSPSASTWSAACSRACRSRCRCRRRSRHSRMARGPCRTCDETRHGQAAPRGLRRGPGLGAAPRQPARARRPRGRGVAPPPGGRAGGRAGAGFPPPAPRPPPRDSLRALAGRVDVAWLVGQGIERVREQAVHFPGARVTASIADVLADARVPPAPLLTPPSHPPPTPPPPPPPGGLGAHWPAPGTHVRLKNPRALDPPDAQALVDDCERAGVTLGVVLQHRVRPAAQRLKALLDARALGRLTRAAVDIRWWRPQSYYDMPGRGPLARDGGGVLMTQAIHTLVLFRHVAGPVAELAAFATTSAVHRMECEDVVTASGRLQDGALFSLHATTAAYPGFAERIDLSGTLGTACLTGGELVVQWCDGREERCGEQAALGAGAAPMAFGHAAHQALLEDFVGAVQGGLAPAASGRSALAVHRLIDALTASSASRSLVALDPLTDPACPASAPPFRSPAKHASSPSLATRSHRPVHRPCSTRCSRLAARTRCWCRCRCPRRSCAAPSAG